jgi:hypothetical protein
MGQSKQQLISDIELRVTESKPSDDLQLEHSQIVHWLDLAANTIVPEFLNRQIKRKERIDPQYMRQANDLQLLEESSANNVDEGVRHYIDISSYNIMSLDRDMGVVRVSTKTGVRISSSVNQQSEDRLQNLYFAKPSRDNLVWYREDGKIFIEGYGNSIMSAIKLNMTYIPVIDIESLADGDIVPISGDILPFVLEAVEAMALKELGGIVDDKINDGDQTQ